MRSKNDIDDAVNRENPKQRKIITALKLAEVSLVEKGGHQDAHIAIARTKPEENPVSHLTEFLRAAVVVAATTPINRAAMTFNQALQLEKADEMMEAMRSSFWSIMWSDEPLEARANMLKQSAAEFADEVAKVFGTAESAGTEVARMSSSGIEHLKNVVAAADAKDEAALMRLIPKEKAAPIAEPVAAASVEAPAQSGNLGADLQRAAAAVTDPNVARLLRDAEAKIKAQDEVAAELVRQKIAAQKSVEDAEIVRTYGARESVKGTLSDAEVAELVRKCRESGVAPILEKVLARADATAALAVSQVSTAPTAPNAQAVSRAAINEQVDAKAQELMRNDPKKYPNLALARGAVWAKESSLRQQYEIAGD